MFLFLSYNPSPFSSGGSTASPSSENLLVILVLSSSSSSLPSSFIHDQKVITKCSKWERSSFTISQLETEVWLVWSLLLSVFLYQNENLHFSQDVWGDGGCQSLSVSFFKHSIFRNQGNIREVVAALKPSQRIFKKKSLLFLLPLFATNLPLLLWMLMLVSSSLSLSSTSTKIQTWAQWSSPSLSVYSYNPSPFSSGGSTASHLLWKPHGDLCAGLLLLFPDLVFHSSAGYHSSAANGRGHPPRTVNERLKFGCCEAFFYLWFCTKMKISIYLKIFEVLAASKTSLWALIGLRKCADVQLMWFSIWTKFLPALMLVLLTHHLDQLMVCSPWQLIVGMQPQTEWLNSKEELSFSMKPSVAKHGLDDERRKLDETGSALFHKRLMKR